jgi:hypothetical protein
MAKAHHHIDVGTTYTERDFDSTNLPFLSDILAQVSNLRQHG